MPTILEEDDGRQLYPGVISGDTERLRLRNRRRSQEIAAERSRLAEEQAQREARQGEARLQAAKDKDAAKQPYLDFPKLIEAELRKAEQECRGAVQQLDVEAAVAAVSRVSALRYIVSIAERETQHIMRGKGLV